jgi:UPF0755 protein
VTRGGRIALAALLALGLAAALAALAAQRWWEHTLSAPSRSEPVVVDVPRGAAFRSVAAELAARGAIRDARAFAWLARLEGKDGALKSGEYEIAPGLAAREVLALLVEGRVRLYGVSLPEGLRMTEIAARLAEAELADAGEFLAIAGDPAVARALGVEGETLEGYLFPETYRFPRDVSERQIAEALVAQFHAVWREIEPLAHARKLSMREVTVLASLIEKETGAPEERPLISAVFHNRLARGMRLETDPSVIYGIADFDGNLRRVHLEDATNPYNTYQIAGLPPGPIASPGEAALRAAVSPAPNAPYFFFVSRNDGTHVFTRTYREHVNEVNRWQRRGRKR